MIQLPLTTSGGPRLVDTAVHRSGLSCRVTTYDWQVAGEVRCYGQLPVQDRIVLDVGANIGAFTRWASLAGAAMVVAIEPEESNFACLQHNTRDLENIVLIRGCLDHDDGETTIWLSPNARNPGNTSQTRRAGRFSQTVPTVSLSRIMAEYTPSSVKLDCEGAEYSIGQAGMMPSHVQDVVAEVHISGFPPTTVTNFVAGYSGWRTVTAPRVTPTAWHTIGQWSRT